MEAGLLTIVYLLVAQGAKMLGPLIPRSAPRKGVWVEIADISSTSSDGRLSDSHQAHGLPRLNPGYLWRSRPGNAF